MNFTGFALENIFLDNGYTCTAPGVPVPGAIDDVDVEALEVRASLSSCFVRLLYAVIVVQGGVIV